MPLLAGFCAQEAEQKMDGCFVSLLGFPGGFDLLSFQPRFKEVLDN